MSCWSRKAKQVCETPLSFAVKLDPCRPCPWALSPHRCPLAVRLRRVSKGQHAFICQLQTSSEVCTQSKPQNPNILLNPTAPPPPPQWMSTAFARSNKHQPQSCERPHSCNRIRFVPNKGCEIFSNVASFNRFETSYFVPLLPPVGNY